MFDIVVTKKDIKAVEKFLEDGILVQEMNKRGLSIGAMALVLTGIETEIIKAKAQLYIEGDTSVLETEDN
jgi:hypothetical protein